MSWRKNFFYDRKEAHRATFFFENELHHIEGKHADQPFILLAWERKLIRRIFGWKRRSDKTRKHRKVLLFIPRGQGKSIVVAGCGTYLFAADKEPGSHVIAAAADSEQAEIIFKYAKGFVLKNKKLSGLVGRPFRRSMAIHSTGSSFKVISSAADTKHGMDLHGVLIDELHAQKNRELVDVLITSTRTRRQPLVLFATTAGFNKNTICGEVYDYAVKVRDGIVQDDEFLPAIFESTDKDDWKNPETWKKANPSFGVSVMESYLAAQCKMAQEMPSYENTFRRLHLNQWTEQEVRWVPMDKWAECGKPFYPELGLMPLPPHMQITDLIEFNEESLLGRECIGGLDLSDRLDITAFCLLFKLEHDLIYPLFQFWCPQDTALERQRKGQAPYFDWIKKGYMKATPGNDIDYNFIRAEINRLSNLYMITEIGFDPWNANQLTHSLNDEDGIVMVPVRQGFGTLSSPSKEFEAAVVGKRFRHGNNPVLNWMASNVCITMDPAGNIKPVKNKDKNQKIDGISALIIALSRLIVHNEPYINADKLYSTQGVKSL